MTKPAGTMSFWSAVRILGGYTEGKYNWIRMEYMSPEEVREHGMTTNTASGVIQWLYDEEPIYQRQVFLNPEGTKTERLVYRLFKEVRADEKSLTTLVRPEGDDDGK